MQDLTRTFVELAARRRDRWSAETESLVATVSNALGGRVDWDSDAGEDWATIVTEPIGAGALVYAQAPLVICADALKLRGVVPSDVVIVQVDDRETADLRADLSALAALFGADAFGSEFDPEHFSANDLWFWTI